MSEHARQAFPAECCGVLLGRMADGVAVCQEVVPGENITFADPGRTYQLDWQTMLRCVKRTRGGDEQILGFYHSHPNGDARPSRRDRADAWDDVLYLILAVDAGRAGESRVGHWRCWRVGGADAQFEEVTVVLESPKGDRRA